MRLPWSASWLMRGRREAAVANSAVTYSAFTKMQSETIMKMRRRLTSITSTRRGCGWGKRPWHNTSQLFVLSGGLQDIKLMRMVGSADQGQEGRRRLPSKLLSPQPRLYVHLLDLRMITHRDYLPNMVKQNQPNYKAADLIGQRWTT